MYSYRKTIVMILLILSYITISYGKNASHIIWISYRLLLHLSALALLKRHQIPMPSICPVFLWTRALSLHNRIVAAIQKARRATTGQTYRTASELWLLQRDLAASVSQQSGSICRTFATTAGKYTRGTTLPPIRGNRMRKILVTAKPSEKKRPATEPKAPKTLPPTVAKNNKRPKSGKSESISNPVNHNEIPAVTSELRKQMDEMTIARQINNAVDRRGESVSNDIVPLKRSNATIFAEHCSAKIQADPTKAAVRTDNDESES